MDDSEARGPPEIIQFKPTYILGPAEDERFYPSQVKAIAQAILDAELAGKEYDEEEAKDMSCGLCEMIKAKVKEECNMPRYKIVVQVVIGEMKDQGVRVASRCLWDANTDNYASASFPTPSLGATAMVFGCYTD